MESATSKPTIVVTDDDDILRELVSLRLSIAGYKVVAFSDGPSTLRALETLRPILLILDWSMPGMDGLEVLRRLQRRTHTANLPVMMLTARGQPEDVRQALDFGVIGYMVKPFEADDLLKRVERLIKDRRTVWTD